MTEQTTEKTEPKLMDINISVPITDKRVKDMLCTALEGGSNYWYRIVDHKFPEGVTHQDFKKGGKFTDPDDYYHSEQLIPLHPECSTFFVDKEEYHEDKNCKRHELNREALIRGMNVMAEKYPHHFKDFIEENDDADTADVYLQCCLFGELVFG